MISAVVIMMMSFLLTSSLFEQLKAAVVVVLAISVDEDRLKQAEEAMTVRKHSINGCWLKALAEFAVCLATFVVHFLA